ncbi:MAG: DNA gyrase subunit A [Lachnospirales bacterium]
MSDNQILPVNIEDEMQKSYIEYAMSVIVSRALPDVRDGLKPVHRRILYSMNEMGLDPSKGYKKSARITGDTMGKYHPHGDSSIYDAMVRMAQSFSMRYMLVDGHGNFGSIDGDGAAAQRYTEAKLSKISTEMLRGLDKNTVDFQKNYDEELEEPVVLPSRFPNLLVNGSSGIAVGMATNIPPHNLCEVIDGVVKLIDVRLEEDREIEIDELLEIIKGPDFPTGANILGRSGIVSAYRTGRGKIVVRSEATIETLNNGREQIIITEIPYQVNKAKLQEKIADLVKDKKVEGISDLRDESDRNGIRIVIDIKKDSNANVVLNKLYKFSQLQETFGVIMLALVDNQPRILNLYEMLYYYVEHQKEVVTRRTQFDLDKALKRAHIIEGYLIALDNIDEVISIIKASETTRIAIESLMERFNLSEEQSTAIPNMQLRRLTGLERGKLDEEYKDLEILIDELKSILQDERLLYNVIKEEILNIKNQYGDERRSKFLEDISEINMEDIIEDEASVITLTQLGYIKRLPLSTYKSQNRGGKGIIGMNTRDEDNVKDLYICTNHESLMFFTNKGKVFSLKAYEIPEAGRTARGLAVVNLLNLESNEKVASIIPIKEYDENEYFLMLSKQGIIKKTYIDQYKNIRISGLIALNIRDDDELIKVLRTTDYNNVFIATKKGQSISFNVGEDLRALGRYATGVRGIRLNKNDEVIDCLILENDYKILSVSENGYGKLSEITEFRKQSRGGKGIKCYKITEKTGDLISLELVNENEELMILNSDGVIIRIRVSDISTTSRVTSGVKLIDLNEEQKVIGINKITEDQIELELEEAEMELNGDSIEEDLSQEDGSEE